MSATWYSVQFTTRPDRERGCTWVHASLRNCPFVNVTLWMTGDFIPTPEQQLEVLLALRQAWIAARNQMDQYVEGPRAGADPIVTSHTST